MICVPCILVPVILFLWTMIRPIIYWFRKPNKNAVDQNNDGKDDVCSLLSACLCINKKKKLGDRAVVANDGSEMLLEIEKKPPAEVFGYW